MTRNRVLWCVLALSQLGVSQARAATITFDGPVALGGSGKGTVLGLLSLKEGAPGNNNPEAGTTAWDGFNPTFSGDTFDSQHFFSRSVLELTADGITGSIELFFQVNEDGPDHALALNSLSAGFFGANGSLLFTGDYLGLPLLLTGVGQGTTGWLFNVALTPPEIAQFYANTNNHLGAAAGITDAGGGSDNFFLAPATDLQPVPEPTSLVLLGTGLCGWAYRRARCSRS